MTLFQLVLLDEITSIKVALAYVCLVVVVGGGTYTLYKHQSNADRCLYGDCASNDLVNRIKCYHLVFLVVKTTGSGLFWSNSFIGFTFYRYVISYITIQWPVSSCNI